MKKPLFKYHDGEREEEYLSQYGHLVNHLLAPRIQRFLNTYLQGMLIHVNILEFQIYKYNVTSYT